MKILVALRSMSAFTDTLTTTHLVPRTFDDLRGRVPAQRAEQKRQPDSDDGGARDVEENGGNVERHGGRRTTFVLRDSEV